MLNYKKAVILAKTWLETVIGNECAIIDDSTIFKPYGWIFFYQSKEFLETGNEDALLGGNAPIIINFDGEIQITGTAMNIDYYIEEYESTLPEAVLMGKPQYK